MKQREMLVKTIAAVALLVAALVSFTVFAGRAADAQTYANTIQALDEKKATVMTVTATAATASTAIAAIPGDASTPIANQIMEISEYLFLVVCFLVLEKSLLTVMGVLGCKVLLPVACVLGAVCVFWKKPELRTLALKLAVLAVMVVCVIPLSLYLGDMIYEVNQASVEELNRDYADAPAEATVPQETEEVQEEEKSLWDKIADSFTETVENVSTAVEETVTNTAEDAKAVLNRFVDAIALFVISYCAIPVLVVVGFLWFVKLLFQIPVPEVSFKPRYKRMKREGDESPLPEGV